MALSIAGLPTGPTPAAASSPEALFAARVASAPTAPLVTYYGPGERSELSARSAANWVAKTYYLLRDELGLGAGDTAVVTLPAHWITVPILVGCWFAGLSVSTSDPSAAVAFGSGSDTTGAPEVFAVRLDAAATGFGADPPAGTQDYLTAVRPQPDSWAGVQAVARAQDPAVPGLSRAQVVAAAAGLDVGARLLVTRDWSTPADWTDTLVAALVAGGSLVLVDGPADVDRIADQERTTVRR